jgi:hypothetical protein
MKFGTTLLRIKCVVNLNSKNYSSIDIMTGYWLEDRSSILDKGKRFVYVPRAPDWIMEPT